MGHANLSNLSGFFIKRLYAKGKLSIADTIEAAVEAKLEYQASEGSYTDDHMLGMGFEEIVGHLVHNHTERLNERWDMTYKTWDPCIEPVLPLTPDQKTTLEIFMSDDECLGVGRTFTINDEEVEDWKVFDTIQWRFSPGWRIQYPEIPTLGEVTH